MKILLLTLILNSYASTSQDAVNKAAEAWYTQSGFKKEVDKELKEMGRSLEKLDKKLPKYLRTPSGVLVFLTKAIKDQQLTCKWEF